MQETLFIDSVAIVLSEHLVYNFYFCFLRQNRDKLWPDGHLARMQTLPTLPFCVKILQVFFYVVSKMAHTPKLDTVGKPFS